MTYAIVDALKMEASPGPHPAGSRYDKGVGSALGVASFGIYQVELPPDAETVRHDHTVDGAEDVYAVISGGGTVVVDDEDVPVRAGQFIAVKPDSMRHVRAGKLGLVFIAVCAPPT
jgi:mannose-6-phosphate isomerase-like protein (cupin superfamily)